MRNLKFLFGFLVVLSSCLRENESKNLENQFNNNDQAQQSLAGEGIIDFLLCNGKNTVYHIPWTDLYLSYECKENPSKITDWPCYKGFPAYVVKIRLNTKTAILEKSKMIFDFHFAFWKDSDKMLCMAIYISSDVFFKKKPCINFCDKKWKGLRTKLKKAILDAFVVMGIVYEKAKYYRDVLWPYVKTTMNAIKCLWLKQCAFAFSPSPTDEDFDDDFDEPDELDQPQTQTPNGCGCNLAEDDGNICFDDTIFGKREASEIKPELTVVGRDENYLYVFGKDAASFNRAIFWSDPNNMGLENCESWGQWDGTFMVFKLQPCRTWFALTNENYAIWLSPDSQTTRVAEGVSVVPYGNGH
ncbi:MAG: hypothetical protein AB1465_07335, partial [Patescibacteria group bacterium]